MRMYYSCCNWQYSCYACQFYVCVLVVCVCYICHNCVCMYGYVSWYDYYLCIVVCLITAMGFLMVCYCSLPDRCTHGRILCSSSTIVPITIIYVFMRSVFIAGVLRMLLVAA